MPWTAKSFEQRHHHGLTAPIAAEAARQAAAILRSGAPEGIAIATANKRADRLMAERHHHTDGGTLGKALHVLHRQMGGMMPEVPFFERSEAYGLRRGFISGEGSGRFDKNNVSLPSSSYILPADVIAGLGEGNSLAGARVMDSILSSMPHGIAPPREGGRHPMPRPPSDPQLAQGLFEGDTRAPIQPETATGGTPDRKEEKTVPIKDADGEYRVLPEQVAAIGQYYWSRNKTTPTWEQALKRGSGILDEFVREERGRNIKELRSLHGPKGSRNAGEGHNRNAKGPEK